MTIPVIDLFAGPGGLAEGFSSLASNKKQHPFKVKLSIEKDYYAHKTLELRAFVRSFPQGMLPGSYYDYLVGRLSREQLFDRHKREARRAAAEAMLAELGAKSTPNDLVDEKIRRAVGGRAKWVLI